MTKSVLHMPSACSVQPLEIETELHQFLLSCQEKVVDNHSQIVSFSQKIDLVEPLAVLESVAQTDQPHFYWETHSQQEAIMGYGITKAIAIEGNDRFIQARQFVQSCLKQTIRAGFHLQGAGPRFWCSFTFFPSLSPSNSPFPAATVFLPRFQIVRTQQDCVLVANVAIDKKANIRLILEQIKQQIQTINLSKCRQIDFQDCRHRKIHVETDNIATLRFKSAVTSALKSIRQEEISKVVIAHALDVFSAEPFNLVQSLHNLRQRHPDCYIFSTSNGRGQAFIGASPERLISIQNQHLVTDALAGSAPRGKTALEDASFARRLLNSKKEKREHQAVAEFIMQRLYQLGLTPCKAPRQILKLANIQHLWTPISAQLPDELNPLDIVAQLHPTPAVAGVPTPTACEQIRHYEAFERGLYAAPLGWIDYQGNSHFIVGIRSALVKGDRARLYAGAGIVAGSDPDKEYAEVQLKLQSLLKALV